MLSNGVWKDSYVNFNRARISGSGSTDEPGKTFSWTTFETAVPATVRVKRLEGGFKSHVIRPARFGITTTNVGGNTVEFTLQPGQKVSVEFDTDIKPWCYTGPPHGLACVKNLMMIFADPLKTGQRHQRHSRFGHLHRYAGNTSNECHGHRRAAGGRPETLGDCGGKRVVVFGPGIYDIGYWQVPNNIEQIHLAGGAVVLVRLTSFRRGVPPFTTRRRSNMCIAMRGVARHCGRRSRSRAPAFCPAKNSRGI